MAPRPRPSCKRSNKSWNSRCAWSCRPATRPRAELPRGETVSMTTTAATWFYRAPEHEAYLLAERVNSSFWEERLGGVYLSADKTDAPYSMSGNYNGADVKLNWDTNKWMRLETSPAAPALAKGLANMLHRAANFRYGTA